MQISEQVSKIEEQFISELGVHRVLAQLLIQRGLTTLDSAKDFLKPSLSNLPNPYQINDIEKAANFIVEAIKNNTKICVYGDYDLDGISSTAVLVKFLRDIGADCMYYIPDRNEGYALNKLAIDKLKKQNVQLIITVDCGITNFKEAEYIESQGMTLIITDHHEPQDQVPKAIAVVNPKINKNKELSILAGVGVAFYLVIVIRASLRKKQEKHSEIDIRRYLWLVAIGTISDIMPLLGVNRILVSYGIKLINSGNVLAINLLAEQDSRIKVGNIRSTDISFLIAPKLNAAGRIASPLPVLELFLSDDTLVARKILNKLDEYNKSRIKIQSDAVELINTTLTEELRGIPVFYDDSFHQGVIGIVAAKYARILQRPVVVCARDMLNSDYLKCSMRTFNKVNLLGIIEKLKSYLEEYGGHYGAAGFSCQYNNLGLIREVLAKYDYSQDELSVDEENIEINIEDIDDKLVSELSLLEPFGKDNPRPIFHGTFKIKSKREIGEKHIKFSLQNGIEAIGFNLVDKAKTINSDAKLTFYLEFNKWRGISRIQLNLLDLE